MLSLPAVGCGTDGVPTRPTKNGLVLVIHVLIVSDNIFVKVLIIVALVLIFLQVGLERDKTEFSLLSSPSRCRGPLSPFSARANVMVLTSA